MILKKTISLIKDKHPNLSEEQIELIIESFYKGFKYYASNPLESSEGILINGLMKLNYNYKKLDRLIDTFDSRQAMLTEEELEKLKQTKQYQSFEVHRTLHKQTHEGQTKKEVFNERFIK
jgi:hypothetical protein